MHESKTYRTNRGIALALAAYVFWGLFPLYFRMLPGIAAHEVVAHRIVWSLVFMMAVLAWQKRFAWLGELRNKPRVLLTFALSSCLISINWLTYVWAVQHGHVLDASLGYFINPLVNVMLGFVVLHERPRPLQWVAVAIAACGVLWLAVLAGHVPYIGLVLAFSFGFYALVRKTASLGALEGLALETILLAPLAAFALLAISAGAWGQVSTTANATTGTWFWLLMAGPFTAVPLLMFAAGARVLPLSAMGVLQYIAPSLQFVLGVWVFHEPMVPMRLVGFALIWLALALYSFEGLWTNRLKQQPALAPQR